MALVLVYAAGRQPASSAGARGGRAGSPSYAAPDGKVASADALRGVPRPFWLYTRNLDEASYTRVVAFTRALNDDCIRTGDRGRCRATSMAPWLHFK
jgi:hypothetical protein